MSIQEVVRELHMYIYFTCICKNLIFIFVVVVENYDQASEMYIKS